jgi:hypothetical protein
MSGKPLRVPAGRIEPNVKAYAMSASGIAPMAIGIQKPSHPKRENARARLSFGEGRKAFLSTCNIVSPGFLKCRNREYVTRSHRKMSLAFGSIVYHSRDCSWRPGDASGLIRSTGEKVHKERGEVSKSASRYNSPICRCSPSRPRPYTRSAIDTFLDPRLHVWKKGLEETRSGEYAYEAFGLCR